MLFSAQTQEQGSPSGGAARLAAWTQQPYPLPGPGQQPLAKGPVGPHQGLDVEGGRIARDALSFGAGPTSSARRTLCLRVGDAGVRSRSRHGDRGPEVPGSTSRSGCFQARFSRGEEGLLLGAQSVSRRSQPARTLRPAGGLRSGSHPGNTGAFPLCVRSALEITSPLPALARR